MKICFLADAKSIHTKKWVEYFAKRKHDVHLISFQESYIPGAKLHPIHIRVPHSTRPTASTFAKLGYLLYPPKIKSIIREIAPDILHAHWASSYGLMGAYASFHPFVLSTWGSDIFNFPKKSILHKLMIKLIINQADYCTSTSNVLTRETEKYSNNGQKVLTIPFGVDTDMFSPQRKKSENITIGIVKNLEKGYGVEYLLRAFSFLTQKHANLRLLIAGDGSEHFRLKALCEELKIENRVEMLGTIDNRKVPELLNKMDIFVVPSIVPESFGVAAIEAASCELPVIASNIGGLPEVVKNGKTGFLVESKDVHGLADKLEVLIKYPELRIRMGRKGREFVKARYDWRINAQKMESLYQSILTTIVT
ncbi:MAG: glycosyltransferase family 4 protein [Calditrichaeota bacterium]|nr:glycosyltransferase family 4 protein [Calditrichota bacterium]